MKCWIPVRFLSKIFLAVLYSFPIKPSLSKNIGKHYLSLSVSVGFDDTLFASLPYHSPVINACKYLVTIFRIWKPCKLIFSSVISTCAVRLKCLWKASAYLLWSSVDFQCRIRKAVCSRTTIVSLSCCIGTSSVNSASSETTLVIAN